MRFVGAVDALESRHRDAPVMHGDRRLLEQQRQGGGGGALTIILDTP
jgi:hypothetical protein